MKKYNFIERYNPLRKEEAETLNAELSQNFHEEYHWQDENCRPIVVATLPDTTYKTPAEVLAVKVPVRKNYGIMVKPVDSDDVHEVGYGDIGYGDLSNIIQSLPEK